ncbi:hypothetical protein BDQ17DRAFT_1373734 [Cyathus striatus]|nr:hypothetical protein BDQ17DRAFT_1373734 [Cyathus striatus]
MSLGRCIQSYQKSDMNLNNGDLVSFIQNNIAVNAVFVAAITSLVYDIIYNFTDEVKYIWGGMKWSLPKLLYIIARYSGLFYLLSANFFRSPIQNRYAEVSHHVRIRTCSSSMWFHTFGAHVPPGSVDLIFILRVCALYGNSKRGMHLSTGYYFTYNVVFQVSLTFSALVSIDYSKSAVAVQSIGCVAFTRIPHFLTKQQTACYGLSLALQSIYLFFLTFFRVGRDFVRDSGGLRNAIIGNKSGVSNETQLTTLVLHDGTLYFFILFGSTLISSVGSALQLNTLLSFINPQGSRLILKLRQMYDIQINECTPAVSRSIFFAEPSGTDSLLEVSREYRRRGGVK